MRLAIAADAPQVENQIRASGLSGTPRRFSDAEQAMLREDIARAAHFSALLDDITETTEQALIQTGRLSAAEIAAARDEGAHNPHVAQMCVPSAYTTSPRLRPRHA